MDWRDTLVMTNSSDRNLPVSVDQPHGSDLPRGSGHRGDNTTGLSAESLQYFIPGPSDTPLVLRASPSPSVSKSSAGSLLGEMMDLRAARAPLATEQEVRAILRRLSQSGAVQPRDVFFYAHVEFLEVIGQTIEEHRIVSAPSSEIYVGVQRLSRLAGRLNRYWDLLQNVNHVYLYGLYDLQLVSQRAGFSHPRLVTFILDRSRCTDLEWFWFLVLNIAGLQTALVAQQVEGDLWSDSKPPSMYKGLWTFDPARVQQIVDILRLAARILLR